MTTKEPMDAVRQYVDAFNRSDAKTMASTFAVPGMILDGMAPHVWHGTTPAQDWYRDVLVEGEHRYSGREPRDVTVTGDNALCGGSRIHDIESSRKQVRQTGATFTVALRKLGDGWRITAWAWAKGGQ